MKQHAARFGNSLPQSAQTARRATTCGKCHNRPMRFFNVAGPVRPDDHYAIQPLDRMDTDGLLSLIQTKQYLGVSQK